MSPLEWAKVARSPAPPAAEVSDNSRGAKSWRKNHPHPIFGPDGRRIYFNVNEADWTQLLVARANPSP